MSSSDEVEGLEAEVNHFSDRVALLRARLYRRGIGPTDRLHELERNLESARRRLREARRSRRR